MKSTPGVVAQCLTRSGALDVSLQAKRPAAYVMSHAEVFSYPEPRVWAIVWRFLSPAFSHADSFGRCRA